MAKYVKKDGTTTVTHNGRIVGNIGSGKDRAPTPLPSNVVFPDQKVSPKNTIGEAEKKFHASTFSSHDRETLTTLWNLTDSQPMVDRINIFCALIKDNPDQANIISTCFDYNNTHNMFASLEEANDFRTQMINSRWARIDSTAELSEDSLMMFAKWGVPIVKLALAHNQNLSEKVVDTLIFSFPNSRQPSDRDVNNLTVALENRNVNPKTLDVVARSNYGKQKKIVESIIGNENTTDDTLMFFAEQSYHRPRPQELAHMLMYRTKVPTKVAMLLADHPVREVRRMVSLSDKVTDPKVLHRVWGNSPNDPEIKNSLLMSGKADYALYNKGLVDPDWSVKDTAQWRSKSSYNDEPNEES